MGATCSAHTKSAVVEAHLLKLRRENGLTSTPFVIQNEQLRRAFNTKLYDEWWPPSTTKAAPETINVWDTLPDDADIAMTRA
jgi:hypothetical protein